jgi:hypothetical protein
VAAPDPTSAADSARRVGAGSSGADRIYDLSLLGSGLIVLITMSTIGFSFSTKVFQHSPTPA